MNICPNTQRLVLRTQKQNPTFRVLDLLSGFFTDLDMSFHPSEVCGLSGSCTRRSPPYSCRSDRSRRCSPGIRQCLGEKKKHPGSKKKGNTAQKCDKAAGRIKCPLNVLSSKRCFASLFSVNMVFVPFPSLPSIHHPSTIPPPSLHRSPWIPP